MAKKDDMLMSSGRDPQEESTEKQGDPDNLAADAYVYDNPPADSALYELKDVEDSPVGGHQEQVLKDQ